MSAFALLIAVTAIPIVLRFRIASAQETRNDVRLEWAFGLLRVRLQGKDRTRPAPTPETNSSSASHSPRRRRQGAAASPLDQAKRFVRLLSNAALRRRVLRFLADCWRAVHKRIVLHARIGLGDPADTGQLWGLLGPLSPWLARRETTTIVLEPDFTDAAFALDGEGVVRLVPLRLLWLVIALMLSPTVWRSLAALRGAG